uniref:Uncharacterized protein n=1 Tax=Knipowitschia caucasica TaxID=637954 RepID=A0AAV2MII6_KNICA
MRRSPLVATAHCPDLVPSWTRTTSDHRCHTTGRSCRHDTANHHMNTHGKEKTRERPFLQTRFPVRAADISAGGCAVGIMCG